MSENESDRASREYQTASADIFVDTAVKLGVDERELSEQLGYTRGAASAWIDKGRMPKVAAIACEALVKRQGKRPEDESFTVITVVQNGRVVHSRAYLKPGTMSLGGKDYLTFPVDKS